jgi:glycosyltransferase involved in cell wall biosynthesis
MRVLALTFGDSNLASSKYRVYQYIEPLRALGIEVQTVPANSFCTWSDLPKYDLLLIQKKLFPVGQVRRFRKVARRIVYDTDDATWHPHGRPHFWLTNLRTRMRLKAITRKADMVLTANEVLAAHLRPLSRRLEVVPMSLDETIWRFRSEREPAQHPCIGWAGHPVNLRYLEAIEPALAAVQHRFPKAEFRIFCGEAPRFKQVRSEQVPFDPQREAETIRSFDIGLLPLPEGPFAEGKSPIKALQYMASGAATVLTPLGATRMMFQDGHTGLFARTMTEWQKALETLLENPARICEFGSNAREHFETYYALSRNVGRLAALLRNP